MKKLIVAAFAAVSAIVQAETLTFVGGTRGWDDPTSWKLPDASVSLTAPTLDDDVAIGSGTVTSTVPIFAKSITMTGGTFKLGDPTTLPNVSGEVAGDVTVSGSAKLYFYAGRLADLSVFEEMTDITETEAQKTAYTAIFDHANLFTVGGTLSLGGTSVLYPANDPLSGVCFFFKVGDFTLASGAKVDGDARGFDMVPYTGTAPYNARTEDGYYYYSLGTGFDYNLPGGYGGFVPNKNSTHGNAYGYARAPFLPGSGGGYYSGRNRGGASFCLFAANVCSVSGTVSCNGGSGSFSLGSGGGIWLMGKTVTLASTAKLLARGQKNGYTYASAGGRISIGENLAWDQVVQLAHGETPSDAVYYDFYEPACTFNVASGKPTTKAADDYGTVTRVEGFRGRVKLTVGGWPAPAANERITLGEQIVDAGETTFSTDDYGYDAGYPESLRYAFAGYVVSNATEEVKRGDAAAAKTFAVDLDSTKGPYTLTWLWGDRQVRRQIVSTLPGATIRVNETDYADKADFWAAPGADMVTATAPSGATFVGFVGDVPGMRKITETSFTFTARPGDLVAAVFRRASPELQTKTWASGKDGRWNDAANWTPAGVPSFADRVVISSGTCRAGQFALAGALEVAAGAKLRVCSTANDLDVLQEGDSTSPGSIFVVEGSVANAGTMVFGGHEGAAITNQHVEICGDLTLSGAATLDVYAVRPSGPIENGDLYVNRTEFAVNGTMTVGGTSVVRPFCDPWTGLAVRFVTGKFVLGATASVNADNLGWKWYKKTAPDNRYRYGNYKEYYEKTTPYYTCAKGPGLTTYSTGASYGGKGVGGLAAYGEKYAPFLPGSPCGLFNDTYPGGGVIWVSARTTIQVDGKMTASGMKGSGCGESGGGIWLTASGIIGSETASLEAKGRSNPSGYSSRGGGGRIALAVGVTDEDTLAALAAGELPSDLVYADTITLMAATAAGGSYGGVTAESGTLTTVVGPESLKAFNVIASPVNAIAPSPDYGGHSYAGGTEISPSVPEFGYDPGDPEFKRWTSRGYVLSNVTEEVKRGNVRSFTHTVTQDVTVTWLWDTPEHRLRLDAVEGGQVSVNGGAAAKAVDTWMSDVSETTVEAVPDAGYEFLYWVGEVPFGQEFANPIKLVAKDAFRVKPVFRPAVAKTTRTWLGAANAFGSWYDPANWTDGILPGLEDDVVIAQGAVVASNVVAAGSITVDGANTRLFVAAQAASATTACTAVTPMANPTDRFPGAVIWTAGNLVLTNGAQAAFGAARHDYPHAGVTVGGDLALYGKSKLLVAAGRSRTAAEFASGSVVRVKGDLTLADTSVLYPQSEGYTGGSLAFRVDGAFTVAAGAKVDAQKRGYDWWTTRSPRTYAPGRGDQYSRGASHGGKGETKSTDDTYGFALGPVQPGSSYGEYSGSTGPGGGLVRVHAQRVVMLGTINADADSSVTSFGSASGGGVWLTSQKRFVLEGTITAKGGWTTSNYTADAGGGRIALGFGLSEAEIESIALTGAFPRKKNYLAYADTAAGVAEVFPDLTVSAAGGLNGSTGGAEGTVRYYDARPRGFSVIVR